MADDTTSPSKVNEALRGGTPVFGQMEDQHGVQWYFNSQSNWAENTVTVRADYYNREQIVIAAARTGHEGLIKLALKNLDDFKPWEAK